MKKQRGKNNSLDFNLMIKYERLDNNLPHKALCVVHEKEIEKHINLRQDKQRKYN